MTQMLTPARHPLSGTSSTTGTTEMLTPARHPLSGVAPGTQDAAAPRLGAPPVAEQPALEFVTPAEVQALLDRAPTELVDVSAQGLLLYAEGRLEDVDQQIQNVFDGLNATRRASNAITGDIQRMQALQQAMQSERSRKSDTRVDLTEIEVQVAGGSQSAIDFIRENELLEALALEEPLEDKTISLAQIEQGVDKLRSAQTQLNSRTEMDMMNMQQLVQQRGQVIELTTKLLDAMNQSQKAILQNLGR